MITRRELFASGTALAAASAQAPSIDRTIVEGHDKGVEYYLQHQVTDPSSRWRGSAPDGEGFHNPGTAAGILHIFASAFVTLSSRFHKDSTLMERMLLAIDHLRRVQLASGNFNLLITNFDSPPDTAFIMRSTASAALLAKRFAIPQIFPAMETLLRKSGAAMATGGVHTPNHRWVVCAALAQIDELLPDPSYRRRIDQWLAEGIDIDEDGQYSERSTAVYNGVVDQALVVLANKLQRPDLLDPVRSNLNALLYLLHADGEVVTDLSRRQDQFQRTKPHNSWFPLRYLAVHDANGRYATLADQLQPSLSLLLEFPELNQSGPKRELLPADYEKVFPSAGLARIRRGDTSATVLLERNSRFLALRHGAAGIQAVRFASAFFGKAQFIPSVWERRGDSYHLSQTLDAGYYQPFDPPRRHPAGEHLWYQTRPGRRRTEVCVLEQSATIREIRDGIQLRIQAHGTSDVPVAIEVILADGGKLEGCQPAKAADSWLLDAGYATLAAGGHTIRFGPGLGVHRYTQVRGAQPKLPGRSVYLCGFTPFDHTIQFECLPAL